MLKLLALSISGIISFLGITNDLSQCIPPIAPKPAGFVESDGRYGPMTVTPVISDAGPNNIITVTVIPDISSRSISIRANNLSQPYEVIRSPDYTKYYTGLGFELIDWGPKNLSEAKSEPITIEGSVPRNGYVWRMKNALLPGKIPYWIKVKANHPTIAQRARDPGQFRNGWGTVGYSIEHENQGTSVGQRLIYVGGPQAPSLELNYPGKKDAVAKGLTIKPNDTFEIETKSLGQEGKITISAGVGTKIVGETNAKVSANETKVWKIQPLGGTGTEFKVQLKNSCGEDTRSGGVLIKYNLAGLTKDQVSLSFSSRYTLVPGRTDSFSFIDLRLKTKGDTVVPVPNIPFSVSAVYADSPTEVIKNITLIPYVGDKIERAGQVNVKTSKDGDALIKLGVAKLTPEEAKRKIILRAVSNELKGLTAETALAFELPKELPKKDTPPQTPRPTPSPQPKPAPPAEKKSEKIFAKNLVITPHRTLDGLKENDKVIFTAKLIMSDSSTQVLKTGVKWTLIGQVGSITSSGVFTAKLDEAIAEFGEGSGIITATYVDANGNTFIGKTPTFRIEAFIPDEANPGG